MKYFFGGDAELGDGVPASRLPVGDVFPGVAVLIVRVSSEMRTGETQLIYLYLKDAPKILRGCVLQSVSSTESTGNGSADPAASL